MRTTFATVPGSAKPNEDFVAITDDLVVMLDGATTPGAVITGCSHTTRWFARSLGTEIFKHIEDEPVRDLADSLALAIKRLSVRHQATCDVTHPGHPSATVALLRESAGSFDYLVLGDSTVIIESTGGVQAISDDRLDAVAAADHARLLATPHGSPEHDDVFAEFTTMLQKFRNKAGGFWVASTDPNAAYEAILGSIPCGELVRAAVLTDGASRLADRFHQASWLDVLDIMSAKGPAELVSLVRGVEASDADGKRWPRGKVSDDATAALCEP